MLGLVRRLLISLLLLAAFAFAQDPPPAPAAPKPQVFSGFVTDFTPIALSVSRKNASGKEMVHKSFTMDEHTKVEGKIKLKARVTVQFTVDGDNNRAVRIIVRGN
jgi:hypothetical protein